MGKSGALLVGFVLGITLGSHIPPSLQAPWLAIVAAAIGVGAQLASILEEQ
jgi:hypothetical protein